MEGASSEPPPPAPLDTAGLVLVISDKRDPERDAVASEWTAAGGDVLRLGRFWEPPPLEPARVRVYGADAFCQVLAQKLSLELVSPADDLLLHLPPAHVRRSLRGVRISDITALSLPAFVKSAVPKLVRARVYASAEELAAETRGLEPETALITSEIVSFTAEARAWLLGGRVLTIACYEGDADLGEARRLAEEIAATAAAAVPSPCVLDLGLIPDRGWALVEANAAWGAGLNGCDPLGAAACIAQATRAA